MVFHFRFQDFVNQQSIVIQNNPLCEWFELFDMSKNYIRIQQFTNKLL